MTPLQGAMIAATIANDGTQMRPYLIDTLQRPDLTVISKAEAKVRSQPVSVPVATQLRQMMDNVVNSGTGTRAKIQGYEVGGKTGTAQNGNNPDHGWFIGYARNDQGQALVAVAVVIQNAGDNESSQATAIGGHVMQTPVPTG